MIVNCQRNIMVGLTPLTGFLEEVRRALRFPRESLAVQLVSNSAMARLNRTFRNKKGSDGRSLLSCRTSGRICGVRMLSVGLSRRSARRAPSADDRLRTGDIAIAPQTARRNALEYSRSLDEELRILILHGMIHLAGYDHETDHGADGSDRAAIAAAVSPRAFHDCAYIYAGCVLGLCAALAIVSYLDRIYRELDHLTVGWAVSGKAGAV